MRSLSEFANFLQSKLFPVLEEEIGPLSRLDEQFCEVMGLTSLGKFMTPYEGVGRGRPRKERIWMVHAFIAKAVYQFPTTAATIEALKSRPTLRRLCGYDSANDIPSEATFSRAFDQFALGQLPQLIHEHLVKTHIGPTLVGHISRDSTAIEAPERAVPKPTPTEPVEPKKRGRPRRGEVRPSPEPKRLDLQKDRSLEENLADLPKDCTAALKQNSKGHSATWVGYKLHLDVNDWGAPISAIVTGASVHDSQVAIPLAQMSAQRVSSLYQLMDSAYDAPQIHEFIRGQGQVPIIDHNRRRGEKVDFAPAEAQRFKERTTVERTNSLVKERYGARWVRVRGIAKVSCHLMFGVVALTAKLLFEHLS